MQHATVQHIKAAGVVGAGGAGLPTHIKADAKVEVVLVNGASCEPMLASDPYLMERETDTMLDGLEAMMECTGATRGVVCLKAKHAEAVAAMQAAVARRGAGRLEVFLLGDFYPAGDEHVMVREALGKTVPAGGIPLQVGAVVANVETLYNVAEAIKGTPVTHRWLTIACEVNKPMVVRVPVGTLVDDVLAFAGGARIAKYSVVDGGPMMGRVLESTQTSVTKTTSGLLVLPPEHTVVAGKVMEPERLRRITNTICCQCSFCTDLCPRNLLGHPLRPHVLMRVPQEQVEANPEAVREAMLCSECGICEKFACPMGVSPREVNVQIKASLRKKGIRWESTGLSPENNPFRECRTVPTKRLVQRLDLGGYDPHPHAVEHFTPSHVRIPLHQHIGAPAHCVVSAGQKVQVGDVIGEIPEGAMGARVHASLDGVVESVANGFVTIRA